MNVIEAYDATRQTFTGVVFIHGEDGRVRFTECTFKNCNFAAIYSALGELPGDKVPCYEFVDCFIECNSMAQLPFAIQTNFWNAMMSSSKGVKTERSNLSENGVRFSTPATVGSHWGFNRDNWRINVNTSICVLSLGPRMVRNVTAGMSPASPPPPLLVSMEELSGSDKTDVLECMDELIYESNHKNGRLNRRMVGDTSDNKVIFDRNNVELNTNFVLTSTEEDGPGTAIVIQFGKNSTHRVLYAKRGRTANGQSIYLIDMSGGGKGKGKGPTEGDEGGKGGNDGGHGGRKGKNSNKKPEVKLRSFA